MRKFLVLLLVLCGLILISGCDPNEPGVLPDEGDFAGFLISDYFAPPRMLKTTIIFYNPYAGETFTYFIDAEPTGCNPDFFVKCSPAIAEFYVVGGPPWPIAAFIPTVGPNYTLEIPVSLLVPIYNPDFTIQFFFKTEQTGDRMPDSGCATYDIKG